MTESESKGRRSAVQGLGATLFCVAMLAVALAAAHPVVQAGVGDDWAYTWSAKVLAETGRVAYTGWAMTMLGWQLYLGAAFIKLFGFSFLVVRLSVMLVALATAAILHRIFLRLGCGVWNATIATLTIVLSPLFLPLASTFYSDVPGLFALMVCLYLCLRALQARTDRAAVAWLVAAGLSNAALGTVRQIAWLGVLVMVPSAAWCLQRRKGALAAGAAVWLVGGVVAAASMRWFGRQPYSLHTAFFARLHPNQVPQLYGLILTALLLLLPVLAAFLLTARRGWRVWLTEAGAILGCTVVWYEHGQSMSRVVATVLLYVRSVPLALSVVLGGVVLASLFALLAALRGPQTEPIAESSGLTATTLWILLGPFVAAYLLLVVTRTPPWPRYLLGVLPVLIFGLVRVFMARVAGKRLPAISALLVAVYAAVAIAATHDLFSVERARAAALEQYVAAGYPRMQLEAGFELDGWAQLNTTGYVNDPLIGVPLGTYHPRNPPVLPLECHGDFIEWTPSIQPSYELAEYESACFSQSPFPAFSYRTWLPWKTHTLRIMTVPRR